MSEYFFGGTTPLSRYQSRHGVGKIVSAQKFFHLLLKMKHCWHLIG
uniref:Uncharacterized protein n=1 Tax=Anguilla anguilla TaxID=7936 RepID=A0A0E9TA60_ANGAN